MTPAPMTRVRAYFLVQFMGIGMANGYAGVWLASIGLDSFQIGIVNAVPMFAVLALTLFVGRLADRASDWRQVIIFGGALGALVPLGLYVSQSFWWVLAVWTLAAAAQGTILPVADAAAMRLARREGADFGALRALSTIGFLLVVLGGGYLLGERGVALFLPLFIAFGMLRAVVAVGLPQMRARDARLAPKPANNFLRSMKPWMLVPLIAWALIDANHFILNGFQALLWSQEGISTQTIGVLITTGALAETIMFFGFARLARRFQPLTIMLAAALVSVFRWVAMSLAPDVPVLFALQLLHAFTFAMGYLAAMNFIADHTEESVAAEAQSFLKTLELTVAAIALFAFGALAEAFGTQAYLACALLALMGGFAVLAARRWPQETSRLR